MTYNLYFIIPLMSLEEFGWPQSTIDSWSSNNEWTEKISDAMREAIAEQARQSKAIAGQIAGSKAQNNAFAKFLLFLLGAIKSEELISTLYKLFFTTKDPHHGHTHIRQSSNYPVIIGMFVPFFWDKVIEYRMQSLYSPLYDTNTQINPTSYLHYLKKLASVMHDNIALDQQLLLHCIMLIYQEFHIVDPQALTEEKYEQVYALIQRELYW